MMLVDAVGTNISLYSGNLLRTSGLIAAISSATRGPRAAFALRITWPVNCSYSFWSMKSRLPRTSNACSMRRFKAPFAASTSPFCYLAPTAVVRGCRPKCRMMLTYSSLNVRSLASFDIWCVAAVEWSV